MYKTITRMILPAMLYTSTFAQEKQKSQLELLMENETAQCAKAATSAEREKTLAEKSDALHQQYMTSKDNTILEPYTQSLKDWTAAIRQHREDSLSCFTAQKNLREYQRKSSR